MLHRPLAALALLAAAAPTPLLAQMVQPLGQTDADRLAAQMRQLAANPRDVQALATAGELSLRIGDLSGAAALFARADKVDPRSGRVKAGMAAILVRSERPGEALRFYAQAESYGWPVERFAADRGLAYDLIGQQERAQRDYRTALRQGSDDETVRRYALSLGISGQQQPALEQLDPLVRRQDRAAWRARAFVMAMGGDAGGAAKIATSMMPAGMAQGLATFLQRLPSLSPTDRAFAVHFGEIYPTPERIADARLIPALPALGPDPYAPRVQVAAATPVATPTDDRRDRRSRRQRERDRRSAVALAAAQPRTAPATRAPVQLAQVQPLPQTQPQAARPVATPNAPAAAMRENDVRVASAPTRSIATTAIPPSAATLARTPPVAAVQTQPVATVRPQPVQAAPVAVATTQSVVTTPVAVTQSATTAPVTVAAAISPPVTATTLPTASPTVVASAALAPAPAPVAPVESAAATDRADSVLARIVASLSIPAAELEVAPLRPDPAPVPIPAAVTRAPASNAGKRIVAEASAKEARDATLRRAVAAKLTGDAEADEPTTPTTRRGRRGATTLAAADTARATGRRGAAAAEETPATTGTARTRTRRGAAEAEVALDPKAKRAADRKAAAGAKAAAEKKALTDKEAAEKKAARSRPARIWVQVAGGANEGDLPKAWRAVQAKAPALAGKSGYSTPLRATNRVLTGPFKTEAEARAAVNQLAKQGVSAFTFTSEAGQDVKKLGTK